MKNRRSAIIACLAAISAAIGGRSVTPVPPPAGGVTGLFVIPPTRKSPQGISINFVDGLVVKISDKEAALEGK